MKLRRSVALLETLNNLIHAPVGLTDPLQVLLFTKAILVSNEDHHVNLTSLYSGVIAGKSEICQQKDTKRSWSACQA